MRSFHRAPRAVSADTELQQSLQDQNRALQAETARLQALLPSYETLCSLQTAVDTVSEGIVLCDSAGQITLNPAARALLGLPGAPAPSEMPPDLLRYPSGQSVPPGALPWVRAALTRLPTDYAPYAVDRNTHDLRPVEIAARPVPDGAVATVRDLSAQAHAADAQAQAGGARQALADAAHRLSRTSDFQSLCQIAADAALTLLPPAALSGARALLCTFSGQGQPLVLQAVSPDHRPKRPRRHADTLPPVLEFDAQSPLLWKVYLDRQIVAAADVASDPLFAGPQERALLHASFDTIRAPTVRAALMLPLLPGAACAGHLLLTSPIPNAFAAQATREALALLASLAAFALARAQSDLLRRRQEDQFSLLHQAALAAAMNTDSSAFPDTLTRAAAAALGAALCTLSLTDAPAGPARRSGAVPLHFWGTPPPEATDPTGTSVFSTVRCACTRTTQQAVRRGVPVAQAAIPNPPLGECLWRAFSGQSGTHSALALPLRQGDTVCGAFTVFRHGSAPFSPHELSLAETFAAFASLLAPLPPAVPFAPD